MGNPELPSQALALPLELTGNMPEDRQAFYELAKASVTYQTMAENVVWEGRASMSTAAGRSKLEIWRNAAGNLTKKITELEIVVNKGWVDLVSLLSGVDYHDIIPFVIEHEIYEGWLGVKRGMGQTLQLEDRHMLARRREYLVAKRAGLMEKLFQFHMESFPNCRPELERAKAYAQRAAK